MAGERYAKITLQVTLSHNDVQRGFETKAQYFTLAGQVLTVERGGGPGQFVVPDPDQPGVGELYALQAVQNLVNVLSTRIFALGLPYTVSTPVQVGTTPDAYESGATSPIIEFSIVATGYGSNLNLDFSYYNNRGWAITENLYNVSPVFAAATVTNATLYGAADGAITITASGGSYANSGGSFLYTWDDGTSTGATRQKLKAGTYTCLVSDLSSGATTSVTATVLSDPRLEVVVNTTANSITLVVSGGVGPYTYTWTDGATTATRTGLPAGTYHCTVQDAHGATVPVQVILSSNNRYWFSGNPVVLSLDAGPDYRLDPKTKPGLSFVCQVWIEMDYLSDVFVQVGQDLEQPAAADGRTTFEVQELLEPFVVPQLPALGGADVQRVDGCFRRFFLKHYERTTNGAGTVATVNTNYLVHGGLDYWEAVAGTWFTGYQATKLPFLSWEPTTKKVLPDQPEYLYFMVPATTSVLFRCLLRTSFADGSQQKQVLVERQAVQRFEVFCLPAGPAQLNLAGREAQAGHLVTQYTLVVEDDAGEALSEVRTYVLDRRPAPTRRYFLYANSLGGWNTLVCRGRASLDLVVKSSTSQNARAAGYDPLLGDYTTNRRTGVPTLKCYTGPRSAAQAIADRDFMLSERVLLLDGGRWLAGQVKDRTFTPYDEDETRRVVQFDFELPRERYYTPRLAL